MQPPGHVLEAVQGAAQTAHEVDTRRVLAYAGLSHRPHPLGSWRLFALWRSCPHTTILLQSTITYERAHAHIGSLLPVSLLWKPCDIISCILKVISLLS